MANNHPDSWRLLSLEESMAAIIDYRGKTPQKTTAGIPLITAKIVKSGRILPTEEYIAQKDYEGWMRRGLPEVGDVVMTTEAPLGEVAQLSNDKVALAQRLITLRGKPSILNNTFLKFLMQSSYVQNQLHARSSGTTVLGIKQKELRKVQLPIPPLPEQRAIAHILGSLDDKIELNRQMNETLESMARAIFKSWFVDFDPVHAKAEGRQPYSMNKETATLFPDSFEDSALGKIPKRWKVKPINKILQSVSQTYPLKSVDQVVFLNTGDILDGQFLHHNYSDTTNLPGQAKKAIMENDILYSEIRPKNRRFAFVYFDSSDYVVSTKLMVLRAISDIKSIFAYYILKQDSCIDYLQMMAESRSGTFPQITFDVLSTIHVALPNEDAIIDHFTINVLEPIFQKTINNYENSKTLSSIRDTLLPKLLSGEIRIKDAEKIAAEIA